MAEMHNPRAMHLYWSVTVWNQAALKEASGGQLSKASSFFFF